MQHFADSEGHVLLQQQQVYGGVKFIKESDTDKSQRIEAATLMLGTVELMFSQVSVGWLFTQAACHLLSNTRELSVMPITVNYLPNLPNGYVATVSQWAYDLGVATACALCPVWSWAWHADMHAVDTLCKTVSAFDGAVSALDGAGGDWPV